MAYKYITDNNLYDKQTYMYSEYGGIDFLEEYLLSRRIYLGKARYDTLECHDCEYTGFIDGLSQVKQDFVKIRDGFRGGECEDSIMELINAYTKTFEVRKRIYNEYVSNWKPSVNAGFEDYEAYLLFAECLILSYKYTKCLKYFSCLLKVDDTLLSIQSKLDCKMKTYLGWIIIQELDIFYHLANENEVYMGVGNDIK